MSIHPIICTHQCINLSLALQIILSSKIVSTNLTVFKQLKTVRSNMSPLLRLQTLMDSTNTTKVPGMLPNQGIIRCKVPPKTIQLYIKSSNESKKVTLNSTASPHRVHGIHVGMWCSDVPRGLSWPLYTSRIKQLHTLCTADTLMFINQCSIYIKATFRRETFVKLGYLMPGAYLCSKYKSDANFMIPAVPTSVKDSLKQYLQDKSISTSWIFKPNNENGTIALREVHSPSIFKCGKQPNASYKRKTFHKWSRLWKYETKHTPQRKVRKQQKVLELCYTICPFEDR